MKFAVTVNTIVKNEERYIRPAILSVLPYVDKLLVWDTGSGDKTVEIINSIKSRKILFSQKGKVNRTGLVDLRNLQLSFTDTPWLLILDGDEIWPAGNIIKLISAMKQARNDTVALVCKTRNCIGDIYHYLPESYGRYKIGPWHGHLNIRAIRKSDTLKVVGDYPLEAFTYKGLPIQKLVKKLEFVDTWYLHATHLKRSNWLGQLGVIDRMRKYKLLGQSIKMKNEELPELLR